MQRLIFEARKEVATIKAGATTGGSAISAEPVIIIESVITGEPVITGLDPRGTVRRDTVDVATNEPGAGMVHSGGAATVHFAVGHPAAEGHFPGNPIIPGAVLLREIVAAILDPANAPCPPFEILWAKFHCPIRPGNTVEIRWSEAGDEVRFACSTASADRPAVTGALRLPLP
jgi:hypothetical protein